MDRFHVGCCYPAVIRYRCWSCRVRFAHPNPDHMVTLHYSVAARADVGRGVAKIGIVRAFAGRLKAQPMIRAGNLVAYDAAEMKGCAAMRTNVAERNRSSVVRAIQDNR